MRRENILKNINKVCFFLLTLIFVVSVGTSNVFANSNGVPFSVEPILPENQNEDVGSYISVSTKEKSFGQEFEFIITNQSNQNQDIKVTVVDAYTSPNGVIQYVKEESENSKIIDDKYKLSNYLEIENDIITLSEDESKIISMPLSANNLEGVLLGGVSFSAIEKGQEQEEGNSTFQINNEINMVIGVMVEFETDQDASFIIDEPIIDPMPSYYAIRLPITLDAPVLIQNAVINYKVMHHDEQLFENQKEFSFAPYTKTNAAIPFEHNEIVENESYIIKGELVYKDQDENEVIKEFDRTFEYVKERSENSVIDTLNVPSEVNSIPFWTIILALFIPLTFLLLFIYWKRKKQAHEAPISK